MSPVHRVFVPLAHGAFLLHTGCIYSLHTVRVPSAQGLCPIRTGCLSCAQGACPLCTQLSCTWCTGYTSRLAHGACPLSTRRVPAPPRAMETDQPHGAHAEPEAVLSTAPRGAAPHRRAAWLGMRPVHLCPGSPGCPEKTHSHLKPPLQAEFCFFSRAWTKHTGLFLNQTFIPWLSHYTQLCVGQEQLSLH